MDTTARFGSLGGGLLTAIGALGLAITGLAQPLTPTGQHLLVLEVTPAQNLLHVAIGVALVIGTSAAPGTARTTVLVASAALGTLGLVGLAPAGDPAANPLALDGWNTVLHLGLAGWGAVAARRRPQDDAPTPETTTAMRQP